MLEQITPGKGTFIFAVAHFVVRFLLDWLLRWVIPGREAPPLWSVGLTLAVGTAIAAGLVYLLLYRLEAERKAIRVLDHDVRNALQIIDHVARTCDPAVAQQGVAAVQRLNTGLMEISAALRRPSDLGTAGRRAS